jgi:hypothetical protein
MQKSAAAISPLIANPAQGSLGNRASVGHMLAPELFHAQVGRLPIHKADGR